LSIDGSLLPDCEVTHKWFVTVTAIAHAVTHTPVAPWWQVRVQLPSNIWHLTCH